MKRNSFVLLACVFSLTLPGCTATVARWEAVNLREQIMNYYDEEIMDNLIRQSQDLPFVHVDISSITALSASKVSGTVGGGDSHTFQRTGAFGMVGSVARTVARPFAYSVS